MNEPVDLAHILDPLLARSGRSLPPVPPHVAPILRRHVADCVAQERHVFLRLVHLADAVGRIPEPIADLLAVGGGLEHHRNFLAARFPEMQILSTDVEWPLASSAFRHIAERVAPGKYLYISVPFASRAEQQDPEHHAPGFTFENLEALFEENDLEVLHASSMFHQDVVQPLRRIVDRLSDSDVEARAAAFAQLHLLDVEDRRAADSRQSEGIRFLGRRRPERISAQALTGTTPGALDARTMADLIGGVYTFLDAGCGTGGSIDQCERRFDRRPALGLDESEEDLRVATANGYRVAACDLTRVELPPACVEFASLMDFLEHLPDVAAARRALQQFGHAARDFLFIRHPSFEDIEYLASLGLKFGWTDWLGHPNRMRLADFRRIFAEFGWRDYVVQPTMRVADSSHGSIVPVGAPTDTKEYVVALHGPKTVVTFDRDVYGKFDIFVRLNPLMPDEEWRRITTEKGWEGTWEEPGPKKVADDMAMRANRGSRPPVTGRDVHALVDSLLWRLVLHDAAPSPATRDAVSHALQSCALERDRGLLHLVHLLDAFNQTSGVHRVLAAGTGSATHAAFLAARFPKIIVEQAATEKGGFDFVFSLERYGHPLLDEVRLRHLVSHVKPGGWLYLSLPTCATDTLVPMVEQVLSGLDYDEMSCANLFAGSLTRALDSLVASMDAPTVARTITDLLRLALQDLDPSRASERCRPEGAKYLVRRRR